VSGPVAANTEAPSASIITTTNTIAIVFFIFLISFIIFWPSGLFFCLHAHYSTRIIAELSQIQKQRLKKYFFKKVIF